MEVLREVCMRRAAGGALIGAFVFCRVLGGGGSPGKEGERIHNERRSLLDSAVGLPVEYRADITLRLLGSCGTGERFSRAELEIIEALFHQSHLAKYPLSMRSIGEYSDTRSARLARSFSLKLDALAIQARVTSLVLRQAHETARDWFGRIRLPATPPAECRDGLIPDPAIYYETLGRLFGEGFSKAERAKGEDLRFLTDCLRNSRTFTEIIPALRLVLDLPIPSEQRARLSSVLIAALDTLPVSPREFSYFEADLSLSKLVQELALLQQSAGQSPSPLLRTYRRIVLRSLTDAMCEDGLFWSGDPARRPARTGSAKRSISFFNEVLAPITAGSVDAISPNIQVIPAGGVIQLQPLREPTAVLPVLRLIRDPSQTEDWRPALARFLTTMRDPAWREGDCKACVFYERSDPLKALVDVVPVGPERMSVVDEYLDLLGNSSLYTDSPIEWLNELNVLLGFARRVAPEDKSKLEEIRKRGIQIAMLPRGQEGEILARMAVSRNPAIAAYANLERICPEPLDLSGRLPPSLPPR
jgi:hypothetical protein